MAKKLKQKQKQTQIVNVHVGGIKRARRPAKRQPKKDARDKVASDSTRGTAPIYAFNPPPIINFPPSFVQQNQPNAWATPPPPIPQRQRAAFVEGEVAELLNQSKTEPVRLTFEGSIAERLEPRKEAAPLEAPAVPSLFEPPPEIGFTEPEPIVEPEFSAEEIARNEAALAREARAAERAAEEEALAEAAANRKVAEEAVKMKASIAAAERGAAAAALADELPFAAEPVLPTTAEELARGPLGTTSREASAEPSKSKKSKQIAQGPIVPFNNRDPRYSYDKDGRQYFTSSGKPVTKKLKEADLRATESLGQPARAAQPLGAESLVGEESSSSASLPPLVVREPFSSALLPPLVTVRSSESVNREPYTFMGSSSSLPPEKPSGLERKRREGFTGKSGSGSVLSGAEETLLSSSAVSANWPYN